MLLHWKNLLGSILVLGCMIVVDATGPQIDTDKSHSNDKIRFQEIQDRLLDIVGNSTSELHSLTEVMGLLHSDTGKEIGKLFVEGFTLGIQQKQSARVIGEFWMQLQGRLSPALQESFDDYKDFFKGLDYSTLPLVWEQLFKKDELGNSLAGMPLGQLVDMIQPTASKYGIDIKAMMNSLMGKGDNNIRDLIISAFNNTDFSSIMSKIINTTTGAMQTSDYNKNSGHKAQNSDTPKKGRGEKALRLFRPLVASLLKENEIDLDADAVLEVLSPLFKSDIIAQASPWIAMLAGQSAEGGLGSIVTNLLGGGEDGFNQQQFAGLIGGLGALMAAGGNNQMDMGSMLNMASMFMGKPSKKKANKNNNGKKMQDREDSNLDLGSLMSLAGKLVGDNINMDTILDFASKNLKADDKRKAPSSRDSNKRAEINKQEQGKPKTQTKQEKRSKNIVDIIEPILVSMKSDKKCNAKIKEAIDLGKLLLISKVTSFGNLDQILPLLIAYIGDSETLTKKGINLETLASSFSQAVAKADWAEFLVSLENKDFRQMLIRNIAPTAGDLVTLLSTEKTQTKIYDSVVPRLQSFMASYGLVGVTLDNFPERLAPMLGLLGKGWNLPFNPTTILVPLKVYLKGLKSWTLAGLAEVQSRKSNEVEKLVIDVLEEDVCEAVLKVVQVARTTSDPSCLPQKLCDLASDLHPDSLKAAVTRAASLVSASGPVLSTPDSNLVLQTVRAISGKNKDCEVTFPGDCSSSDQDEEEEDDSLVMDLMYEHNEL